MEQTEQNLLLSSDPDIQREYDETIVVNAVPGATIYKNNTVYSIPKEKTETIYLFKDESLLYTIGRLLFWAIIIVLIVMAFIWMAGLLSDVSSDKKNNFIPMPDD